jgi:Ca2+-binding RTX toxin-like protein
VQSSVSYVLADGVEDLTLTGTGNTNATGNALANTLIGNAGSNLLDGQAGADALSGGLGNDTYVVDNSGDVVTEAAGAGTDTVRTTLSSYTLGANVENLAFTGTGGFAGSGNALGNAITGGAGNDALSGAAGNDVLNGDAGNDVLDGGLGVDTMRGGAGDDTYVVDNAGDVVTEAAGAGTDTVRTSLASYTLGGGVENLVATGAGPFTGTGNGLNNAITGGGGNDVLSGGGGNDVLSGGAGNDLLSGGTGSDTFVFAPGFGQDGIGDFDSNPVGGQDLIDLHAFGITFADVTIASSGGSGTLVTIGANTITLLGVAPATIDHNDFIF